LFLVLWVWTLWLFRVTFLGSVFILSVATFCLISLNIKWSLSMPISLNLNFQLHSPDYSMISYSGFGQVVPPVLYLNSVSDTSSFSGAT
jgi:hypothetical protein